MNGERFVNVCNCICNYYGGEKWGDNDNDNDIDIDINIKLIWGKIMKKIKNIDIDTDILIYW